MEPEQIPWEKVDEEELQPGLTRKVVHGTNITLAQLSLAEGIVVPSHKHHNEQISSVLKGSILIDTGEEKYVVNQGELLVIPPGVPHKVTVLKDAVVLDTFSPVREDWKNGDDSYLR